MSGFDAEETLAQITKAGELAETVQMYDDIVRTKKKAVIGLRDVIFRKDRVVEQLREQNRKEIPSQTYSNDLMADIARDIAALESEMKSIQKEKHEVIVMQQIKDKELIRLAAEGETDGEHTSRAQLLIREHACFKGVKAQLQATIIEQEASLANGKRVLAHQKEKHDRIAGIVASTLARPPVAELATGVRSVRQGKAETIVYPTENGEAVTLPDYKRLVRRRVALEAAVQASESEVTRIDADIAALGKKQRSLIARAKSLEGRVADAGRGAAMVEKAGTERALEMQQTASEAAGELERDVAALEAAIASSPKSSPASRVVKSVGAVASPNRIPEPRTPGNE